VSLPGALPRGYYLNSYLLACTIHQLGLIVFETIYQEFVSNMKYEKKFGNGSSMHIS
jgi:hypothetical protein